MNTGNGVNGGGDMAFQSSPSPRARQQKSMKFSLYPSRPRTASGDSSNNSIASAPVSPNGFNFPPLPRSPTAPSMPHSIAPQRSFPAYSTNTSDGRPYTSQQPILHHKPSEASRLRALHNGPRSHSSDGRSTSPESQDQATRPRQPSLGLRKEPSRPQLQTSHTFPLQSHDEDNKPPSVFSDARERGMSTSSSRSAITQSSLPLRPSMSIPDYHSPDSIYSRQRNLNGSGYKPARIPPRSEQDHSPYRDYYSRPTAFEHDEVRASIRSALTASSFLGTSGTERSSVMTKSSSATSIYGKDEGMSVDDAIGMYESGFQDSGVEDNDDDRPETADSTQRKRIQGLHEAMNDNLVSWNSQGHNQRPLVEKPMPEVPPQPVPQDNNSFDDLAPPRAIGSNMIVRDSTSFFRPGLLDTPKSSPTPGKDFGPDGGTDIEEGYFSGKASSRPGTRRAQENMDPARDRYGFKKATQHVTQAQYDAWNGPYTEYIARRRKKWVALQRDSGLITDNPDRFPPKSVKVKRFVRKGIPPDWRGAAWFYYAGGPAMVAKHYGVYDDLVRKAAAGQVTQTDDEIIERDLNRTFPDNIYFKPDPTPEELKHGSYVPPETPMLKSLRRVLQAFAIYNPKIGYCQSLNFLAGLLLLFMDEEKSFWMLNIITRVYLPGTHEVNLEGANVDLGVLMTAIKDMMPAIWAKIGGELDGSPFASQAMRLPPITLCTTAWFMSCFIGTLPIESTLRVWDSFFFEGSKTLFRIALTIFKMGEAEIKSVTDPMEIFQVVQNMPRKMIDANLVMESCFKRRNGFGHISQETIEKGRAERRKGYAKERERVEAGLPEDVTPARTPGRKNTLFSRRKRGPSDTV